MLLAFGQLQSEGDKSPLADIKEHCIAANGNVGLVASLILVVVTPMLFDAAPGIATSNLISTDPIWVGSIYFISGVCCSFSLISTIFFAIIIILIFHATTNSREARYLANLSVSELSIPFKLMVLAILFLLVLFIIWVTIVLFDLTDIDSEAIANNDFGSYPVAYTIAVGICILEWNYLLLASATLVAKYYKARRMITRVDENMHRDFSTGLLADPGATEVWALLKEYFGLEREHAHHLGFKEFVVLRMCAAGGGLSYCGDVFSREQENSACSKCSQG